MNTIDSNGTIRATNQRDHEFLRLTKLTDEFLKQRKEEGYFHELGFAESCMLPAFVMWLKDNDLLTFKDKSA